MVRSVVLSEYTADPPDQPGRVKIATLCGAPLYCLERVAELIQGLRKDCYIDSEWCENGKGAWAACDAYSIKRLETALASGKSMTVEYFVKFAVSKTGQLVLLVSCHV